MVRANRDDDGAEVGDGDDDAGGTAVGAADGAPTEEPAPTEPTAGVPS